MARYSGVVGYGVATETANGVMVDTITERTYFGDVVRNTMKAVNADQKVNADIEVSNSISIVSDPYANENLLAIRYISWLGTLWTVDSVEVQSPRLLLRLGGVYNGPTAE